MTEQNTEPVKGQTDPNSTPNPAPSAEAKATATGSGRFALYDSAELRFVGKVGTKAETAKARKDRGADRYEMREV